MSQPAPNPIQQFSRYLLVGGFNTVFGYAVFALLNWLFGRFGPYSYMYAASFGSIITISVAFLGYKWFVFRTKGNYLAEWLRCFAVYGTNALIGLACLPILVTVLRPRLHNPGQASYIAAALMTGVTVLVGFVGHRKVSFRQGDRRTSS
jgi:putative flippase GtrA